MSQQRKISVLLDPDDYDRFEDYCRKTGHKKSTLISKLVRDLMDAESFATQRLLFNEQTRPAREETE